MRDNGGHAVALRWSMANIYGIDPGEVFWAASDVGWVVGHSYIVYAPLLAGCTTVLYEGKPVGTPDAGAFWRVIAEHGVKALFTAPTAFRAIKKEDPDGKLAREYDLSASSTSSSPASGSTRTPTTGRATARRPGHRPLVADRDRLADRRRPDRPRAPADQGRARRPCRSPATTCGSSTPTGRRSAGRDRADRDAAAAAAGPLPTLWDDDERFVESYLSQHPGFYLTGDGGYIDEDGYLFVMGRIDDVINVAGHRLSTGPMEEVIATHPAVAECAVIGVADDFKGQVPLGFVVLKAGVTAEPAAVSAELVPLVRDQIGPVAALAGSTWWPPCPRPGPARSCARPCAVSPTARTRRSPPPSRTPRSSTLSARCWPTRADPGPRTGSSARMVSSAAGDHGRGR